MTKEFDVLVVGAGACGLSAAIAAADAGVQPVIIEKMDRVGGNSALSTGSVPAAGSRFQRDAGIADSPDQMVHDLMVVAKETDDLEEVRRLAEVSGETVEWLVDVVEARLQLITAYMHIGHSVPRLHAPQSRRGKDLVDDLVRAVERRGIPIAVGNAATELLISDGAVQGATVRVGTESESITAAKTILAVNGFAGAPHLVKRFCPEIAGARYFGALGSTGEAIIWGEAAGAALANIGAYQGYAAVADPHGSLLSWTTIEKGGIIVGPDARRFGNEALGYSGYAKVVLENASPAFAIFDQRIFEIASQEEEFVELWRYGGLKTGGADEIAAACGLDPDILKDELATYASAAAGQSTDPFGRPDFGIAPLTPPYYSCRIVPGLFHTQGGLRIDRDGRVLRPDGRPIGNLFAGGGAAAGISGRSGALGYASGNGLLSAIGLGRLAGLAAAREINGQT